MELEHGEGDAQVGGSAADRLLDLVTVAHPTLEQLDDLRLERCVAESEAGLWFEEIGRDHFEDIFDTGGRVSTLLE